MKALRRQLDRLAPHFDKGGRLERFYPLWEAIDTGLYTPPHVTRGAAHVRDAMDLKRMMILVVIAALPCVLMAIFNTGLQANLAIDPARAGGLDGWRHAVIRALGVGYAPDSWLANGVHGALYFLPLYAVTMAVGGAWEVLFAIVRKVEVNEGFFVTGLLFPLILPPTTPLWQAALAISFGVVLAKEVFGGTGMNFVNPALAARAFLFFAYPASMSGDRVWNAVPPGAAVDGFSGATLLAQMRQMATPFEQAGLSWWHAFIGFEPGSLGETSALACLIGAAVIAFTGVGSWRIMIATALGTMAMSLAFNAIGSATNPWFAVPFWWHMVLGGWAFAAAFMVTDPVTAPFSNAGRWVYGLLIGAFIVLIRVVNPAYPESVMLVILFMNVMAPLIDHVFVRANVRRRQRRLGVGHGQ
ncbi:MAG: NADH:ubiquinone reductase (Na(+)-transporting) subunit B [Aquincola sp.]|nr:NADH:ubiquinone reductase (Na(+)-transporting) subunit B [Aquincola sp.]MDH4290165.1 NADH:ubiquinone reductase (Na(+)-transporting) subunit B [Aquincola sp.]MDH5331967.1 NADH:ubiquinone reductase (Na(+)-transporting) subunit B [Aquincola sp.]